MEIFENELDLIESGKIEIHNSIFFRYINYWQQACNNKFNLSSCSNTLTLNHRNEISTCMEFASKPIEFTNGKYNFIPVYEFQLNKIDTLLKGKYGTHSICNADCYLRYICGGICWIKTLEEKKLMCEVAKIASAYALYLKINYIKSKNIINPLKGII
jgi:radical SAM protein with 4Fe4S-binding SPASM domain